LAYRRHFDGLALRGAFSGGGTTFVTSNKKPARS
jgi:hypothetical protein